MKPSTMTLYFATSNVADAHKEIASKGVKVKDVKDAKGHNGPAGSRAPAMQSDHAAVGIGAAS